MKFFLPGVNDYTPEWRKLNEMFHILLPVDRTEATRSFGFEYSIHSPIPENYHTKLTLEEIIKMRVEELADGELPPMLMWSGGIDSTTILCAFIKYNIPLTVGYTGSTQQEYPSMFKLLHSGQNSNIKMMYIGDANFIELQKRYRIITGQVGDQTVGTELYFKPRSTILRNNLLIKYQEVLTPYLLDTFGPAINAFPMQLKDFADFLWFVSFVFKYQFLCLGFMPQIGLNTIDSRCYASFFDTIEFQQWAMSNRELNKQFIYGNQPNKYKNVFKQYILNVNGDLDYYENKTKISSLSQYYDDSQFDQNLRIIDENGKIKSSITSNYDK